MKPPIEAIYRSESRRVLATLIRLLGDFDLAEEALHEAFFVAVERWPQEGVPDNPRAWLVSTGRFKAIDRLRRQARFTPLLQAQADALAAADWDDEDVEDDRLRLIFTCCHPALEPKSQVALTLRTVCGLTTADIARAFLDTEPTMGQRLSRAKAKIAAAGIPFAIPAPEHWPDRLNAVLTTVYLIFTTGYASGPQEPRDLCAEAIHLCIDRPLVARIPRADHRAGFRDIVEHFRALQDQIRQIRAVKNRQIQRLNRQSLGGLRDIDLQ